MNQGSVPAKKGSGRLLCTVAVRRWKSRRCFLRFFLGRVQGEVCVCVCVGLRRLAKVAQLCNAGHIVKPSGAAAPARNHNESLEAFATDLGDVATPAYYLCPGCRPTYFYLK